MQVVQRLSLPLTCTASLARSSWAKAEELRASILVWPGRSDRTFLLPHEPFVFVPFLGGSCVGASDVEV